MSSIMLATPIDFTEDAQAFLICLVRYGVGLMSYALVEIVNEVLAIFVWTANLPSLVMPGLDFTVPVIRSDILGWINWLFPLGFLVPLYTSAFAAAAVYRVMRWWASRRRYPVEPTGGS